MCARYLGVVAFLRLGSTRGVVALLVGAAALVAAVAAATGAALGGGGEAPPAAPLPQAIHDSLSGPKLDGVTARVKFTSNLFGGMTTEQSSALLKGGSGRLWLAPDKLRVELQSDNGDAQIVFDNGKGFVYDGPSNTAYTFAFADKADGGSHAGSGAPPTLAQIEQRIAKAEQHVAIEGPDPQVVAGQPAYEVRVTPKQPGGLIGAAQLAWDAARGVPLKIGVYARGADTPALQLEATDIAYGAVDPSVFDLSVPAGAKTVDLGGGSGGHRPGEQSQNGGWSFTAEAPAALGPRARRKLERNGDGYLVLYGKGLDTIAVFEHAAKAGDQPGAGTNADGGPLELPTVDVGGTKATAFGTPLGGLVSFERAGIAYTVAGSQPLDVLEAAAAAL
jgi:outer membrane lipoprotein-sorting protein